MEWGVSKVLVYIFIFMILILAVISNFEQFKNSSSTNEETTNNVQVITTPNTTVLIDTYNKLEESVVVGAKNYIKKHYPKLSIGDNFIIITENLVTGDYIDPIVDIKNKKIICSGYVSVYNDGSVVTYKTYLKCGKNYTTNGYDEKYMEKF